mgnify:FL=1
MNYNVTGSDRKRLVSVIAREIGVRSHYEGMPSMAYTIGGVTVDKNGCVSWGENMDSAAIQRIIDALAEEGFEREDEMEVCTAAEMDGLTISMPMDGFNPDSLDRLQKLVDSKASLIKKSVEAQTLTIRLNGDKVEFPWWRRLPGPEETQAYMAFIAALCVKAKECKRVTAKEHEVESEKFAFRVFLLSLGFKGPESKQARSILMKNLSGSAAFPTKAAAEEFSMKQKAKRAAKIETAAEA